MRDGEVIQAPPVRRVAMGVSGDDLFNLDPRRNQNFAKRRGGKNSVAARKHAREVRAFQYGFNSGKRESLTPPTTEREE